MSLTYHLSLFGPVNPEEDKQIFASMFLQVLKTLLLALEVAECSGLREQFLLFVHSHQYLWHLLWVPAEGKQGDSLRSGTVCI